MSSQDRFDELRRRHAAAMQPSGEERVRRQHPDMRFLAEAYWDLEWPLQQQGFDYCYDKRLYDRVLRSAVNQPQEPLAHEP